MTNFTPEIITKAKAAKTVEELIAIAKDNNVELTQEQASIYFEQLQAGDAVHDEELDLVTGGCGGPTKPTLKEGVFAKAINGSCCPKCRTTVGKTAIFSYKFHIVGLFCYKCCEWIIQAADLSDVETI